MLEVQALDEFERRVTIAELQAATIETAFHPDPRTMAATETLAWAIANSLDAHRPESRSVAIAPLFALKVRVGAALERMRAVGWQRQAHRAVL